MRSLWISGVAALSLFCACNPQTPEVADEPHQQAPSLRVSYEESGENIVIIAQAELIRNLTKAIEKGGTEYAVNYCNQRVSPLMDSLSNIHHATISRLSLKNRNPENYPQTELEETQMNFYSAIKEKQQFLRDTLYNLEGKAVYFKPIILTNQLCLKCHGNKKQINPETREKISELYPDDQAYGYGIGDFRGAWKVEFEK